MRLINALLVVLALLLLAEVAWLELPAKTGGTKGFHLPHSKLDVEPPPVSSMKPVHSYVADHPDMTPRRADMTPQPSDTPKSVSSMKPRPVVKVVARPSISHYLAGKASWYCKAGVSVCHHAYRPGSMVAAACGKLRRAMGPRWRGRYVTVTSGGRQVTVRLVDWCGSEDKTIDLYWEPMRRLGGTGVLRVRVGW